LLILPAKANTLVPVEVFVPIELNHSEPLLMIAGIFARVSTLLTQVGLFHSPDSAGNGGLFVGSPRLPSIDNY